MGWGWGFKALLRPANFIILNKAAKILRKQMISQGFAFGGRFYEEYAEDSLQAALLEFICMTEHVLISSLNEDLMPFLDWFGYDTAIAI